MGTTSTIRMLLVLRCRWYGGIINPALSLRRVQVEAQRGNVCRQNIQGLAHMGVIRDEVDVVHVGRRVTVGVVGAS